MKTSYDFSDGKRGAVLDATGKSRITIWIDDDILAAFRERAASEGKGYQTLLNETLRQSLAAENVPVTMAQLRKVLREELDAA